jgi:hypothetical protein
VFEKISGLFPLDLMDVTSIFFAELYRLVNFLARNITSKANVRARFYFIQPICASRTGVQSNVVDSSNICHVLEVAVQEVNNQDELLQWKKKTMNW